MKDANIEKLVRILADDAANNDDSRTVLVLEAPSAPPFDLLNVQNDEGYERARRKESERQRKKMLKYQR